MLNILIPMAGSSEEFKRAGYIYSKPLIEVKGKPLIEYVVESIRCINQPWRIIYIVNEEDCIKYHLDNTLRLLSSNCVVVRLSNTTKGALCSVLMAIDEIDEDDDLLIINSDQVIKHDLNLPIEFFRSCHADCGVITFPSVHPRWSYVRIQNGEIVETAEKNPISRNAIAGFYYFKNSGEFFQLAFKTILHQDHLDGLYFVSSVINQFVLRNKSILPYEIDANDYHSFYSVQKVKEFEKYVEDGSN